MKEICQNVEMPKIFIMHSRSFVVAFVLVHFVRCCIRSLLCSFSVALVRLYLFVFASIHCCISSLLRSLVVSFSGCCIRWFLRSLVVASGGCCIRWLLHSFVVVFIHSFIRSFVYSLRSLLNQSKNPLYPPDSVSLEHEL